MSRDYVEVDLIEEVAKIKASLDAIILCQQLALPESYDEIGALLALKDQISRLEDIVIM